MVDLHNRLTTKLLDVGTTSMVIYVEWPLDIEVPHGFFDLIGKLDIERRGWHDLTFLEIDLTQGKATLEVLYSQLSWYYPNDSTNEFKDFEKKAFFAVRISDQAASPFGPFRGKYEEDDETDVFDEDWWKIDEEAPAKPSRPWLYLAVLPVILAGLYLMRKKR